MKWVTASPMIKPAVQIVKLLPKWLNALLVKIQMEMERLYVYRAVRDSLSRMMARSVLRNMLDAPSPLTQQSNVTHVLMAITSVPKRSALLSVSHAVTSPAQKEQKQSAMMTSSVQKKFATEHVGLYGLRKAKLRQLWTVDVAFRTATRTKRITLIAPL